MKELQCSRMGKKIEEEVQVELPPFSGRGEVYSWSIVYEAGAPDWMLEPVKRTPYAVAWIKLAEGPLVTAMLTDVDLNKIHFGMKVEVVTRLKRDMGKRGLKIYGYMFQPVLDRN